MQGTSDTGAGRFSRDNYAVYMDVEWHVDQKLLFQGALRREEFSDFGSTTNGKLAMRYKLTASSFLKAVISSGFRALTPGQANYTGIRTTADSESGFLIQDATILPTCEEARSLGGTALTAEKAKNFSLSISSNLHNNFNLSLGVYLIKLDDRIVKTIDLPLVVPNRIGRASFYTNALNSETRGIDLSGKYAKYWESGAVTRLLLNVNHNQTKIIGQSLINGVNPVSDETIFNLENSLPENRLNLSLIHRFDPQWQLKMRLNYFSHSRDERIQHEQIEALSFVDVEIDYRYNQALQFTLGASNVFDQYPTEINSRIDVGLPYAQRNPVGYDGGMAYLRLRYHFNK